MAAGARSTRVGEATRRVALLIALAAIGVIGTLFMLAPEFLYRLEFNLYDQHFRWRGARPANERVAIVAIDEASLTAMGRWPWSRTVLAQLVRRLDEAGAAVIAFDVLLSEPERSPERDVVERLRARIGACSAWAGG